MHVLGQATGAGRGRLRREPGWGRAFPDATFVPRHLSEVLCAAERVRTQFTTAGGYILTCEWRVSVT